jgi:predicted Rossmann fold flavoprotein
MLCPHIDIALFEQSEHLLQKVKISGGGRCNVTHHCYDAALLSQYYPRGGKALLSIFKRFGPSEMIDWLKNNGVETKVEKDGRIFPVSNSSSTIIQCFETLLKKLNIKIYYATKVINFKKHKESFEVQTKDSVFITKKLLLATGGTPSVWSFLADNGIDVVKAVSSLFSFNTKDILFRELAGVSLPNVRVQIEGTKFVENGPVLITHWGLSGPGILKLSSSSAIYLFEKDYRFNIIVRWIDKSLEDLLKCFNDLKSFTPKKSIVNCNHLMPSRFWENCLNKLKIDSQKNWADISKKEIQLLANFLYGSNISINGKSTNKDEFVTAGGIATDAIDFKTMESKQVENLFFAGEVINIDGYTGGFNFQAAWSTAWVAARGIALQ